MNTLAYGRIWFVLLPLGAMLLASPLSARAQYTFLRQFGSAGAGTPPATGIQFNGPEDVILDSTGNIYVVDNGNNRVQKFTNAGAYISQIGAPGMIIPPPNNQFNAPVGIGIDSANNIFIADTGNNRIQKFNSSNVFVATFGSNNGTAGALVAPYDAVVDTAGNVYVSDFSQGLIQKFTTTNGTAYTYSSSIGSGILSNNTKITRDNLGNIYVADTGNSRVLEFNPALANNANGGLVRTFTNGLSVFNPQGVAVDSSGNLFVADNTNNIVYRFSTTGTTAGNITAQFGGTGSAGGLFNGADGVAVDGSGNVYVTDLGNNRVEVFGVAAVPEAGSLLMLSGMAAGGVYAVKRKKKSRKE